MRFTQLIGLAIVVALAAAGSPAESQLCISLLTTRPLVSTKLRATSSPLTRRTPYVRYRVAGFG